MRHVAGCGRRSPLNLCDVSPPVAVYSECTQHVHKRSLPPNFANGVSAGQSHNAPHRCRSGAWLNRTRRTDRLIHLSAGQVTVTCPAGEVQRCSGVGRQSSTEIFTTCPVGPPPFSAGMTLQLETY